jgi:hypothetical protein
MHDWLDEIRPWLDTETKAILYPDPPDKLVALATESYSLLLLQEGVDEDRINDVVLAIQKIAPPLTDLPFVISQQLELEDALAAQFALACCDCVSAFVRDEIVNESATETFRQLHRAVLISTEFQLVPVKIEHIPDSPLGRQICWQFFGLATGLEAPTTITMYRKKARLLKQSAKKVGAKISCDEID